MLILSIDTSGKTGGVTLAEGDERTFRALESTAIAGGTFSAQLVPTAAFLLEKHAFSPRDLDGFVAVSGPGSFTGLRVGLSAVKGLAEVLQKPIATVSLLEALAAAPGNQGNVLAALDAGRAEVFFGVYEVADGRASRIAERLFSQAEFIDQVNHAHSAHLATSDQNIVHLAASTGLRVQQSERPSSEAVAKIGLRKLLAGETVGIEELDANYIRRSDAEIFSSGHRDTQLK